LAVRCADAASGADLSSRLLVRGSAHGTLGRAFFFDELRRRGFIEGQNLTAEWRGYAQHVDLISQYAAELVNARVDVIATAGEEAVRFVQQATKTIPIVAIVGDMLGPDWSTRWRGQMAIQRASASSYLRLKANDRTSGFAGYAALQEANARQVVQLFHGGKIAGMACLELRGRQ
jgi:hypothetical protein